MADAFELVALALPGDVAPESLPATVHQFVVDCWPGTSRSPVDRPAPGALHCVRRCAPVAPGAPGDIGHFALTLTAGMQTVSLIAHLRRVRTAARVGAQSQRGYRSRTARARSASGIPVLNGASNRDDPASN
ncbi:hypothetical protein B0G71_7552 [Paraburkholderia sp. BL27I4N3]|nr:hypothetical protein B0G71_7552 [Paraburkholderia sp. BL27I4N3]